jgi:hypothetical protein
MGSPLRGLPEIRQGYPTNFLPHGPALGRIGSSPRERALYFLLAPCAAFATDSESISNVLIMKPAVPLVS